MITRNFKLFRKRSAPSVIGRAFLFYRRLASLTGSSVTRLITAHITRINWPINCAAMSVSYFFVRLKIKVKILENKKGM